MDLTGASGLTERLRGKPEMVVMDCSTSPLFEIERVELKSRSFSPERAKITLVGTLERLARVGNESLALERRARSVEEVTPSLMKVSEREGNLERRALMGVGRKAHSGLWKLEAGGGGGGPSTVLGVKKKSAMALMTLATLGMEGGMYATKSGSGRACPAKPGGEAGGCGFVFTVP